MEFNQTKTFRNLAASFASECQAGMRYQMVAKLALDQGYQTLNSEIKTIAKNETAHAKRFFDYIIQYNGNMKNVPVNAGFPFESGTVEDGLKFAAESERNESGFVESYDCVLTRMFLPEIHCILVLRSRKKFHTFLFS